MKEKLKKTWRGETKKNKTEDQLQVSWKIHLNF